MRYSVFIKQSSLIKNRLNALKSQIEVLQCQESLSEAQINKVKIISEDAKKRHNIFESLVTKLFNTTPSDDEIKEEEITKYQNEISDLYIEIHSICDTLASTCNPTLEQSVASNSGQNESSMSVKLPRLNLGIFSGQVDKWIAFHSLYENSVHKNTNLSDVEKFTYLLSSLNGEPLNLIKSLPVTPINYNIAWQTLLKRYHNSRVLISHHINNVLDMPSVNSCSVKHLRNFLVSYHENVGALKALGHDITTESLMLSSHLLRKFDFDFRSRFEHGRANSQNVPTVTELIDFIERECTQLEAADLANPSHKHNVSYVNSRICSTSKTASKNASFSSQHKTVLLTESDTQSGACAYCSVPGHNVYRCSEFIKLSTNARHRFVKDKNLCFNCIGRHHISNCKSDRNCNICHKRHHTLLHMNQQSQAADKNRSSGSTGSLQNQEKTYNSQKTTMYSEKKQTPMQLKTTSQSDAVMVGISNTNSNTVLLATALVHLSVNGYSTVARAVLDSAAQSSFLSESCASTLRIPRINCDNNQVLGISSAPVKTKGLCHVTLSSLSGHVLASSHPMLILDKIANDLPRVTIAPNIKNRLKHLTLADPNFDIPAPVDVLIGADLFAYALLGNPLSLGEEMPIAFNTIFGYILLGTTPVCAEPNDSRCSIVTMLSLDDTNLHRSILRFWTLEEPPSLTKTSTLDEDCERHFRETHSRLDCGRYQVRLPLKGSTDQLGDSFKHALNVFNSLERKFYSNHNFKMKYVDFMRDYEKTGHMVLLDNPLVLDKPHYFLPHHGVLREDKLRVVFNASSATTTGISLNDILHQGSKLHNEIPDIILHFRRYNIVFTCDIKQMFRQIQVHEDDQLLQLIYWREDPSLSLQIYKLTTVTYGMTSSPFLANRVIRQLIEDEGHGYPAAASALKHQLYVDDALLGSDSVEEALRLQQDVIQLLAKGGFSLRKWSSNSPELLAAVPEEHRGTLLHFRAQDQPLCSILGLKWLPEMDAFSYLVSVGHKPQTKRSVLSIIAQIYDPMGWLTPVTFWAKSFMQHIWTLGIQWDDPLPSEMSQNWSTFIEQLPELENIMIPRYLGITSGRSFQLHGFCDASELGFGACVYLRVETSNDDVTIHLLMGKSRVSPLKRISLPRLELCGAHMLANLLHYCSNHLLQYIKLDNITAWCDSTIVLSWIQTPSYRLKTYVANRVAQIQEISSPFIWSHITSQQNPADCSSRGLLPSALQEHNLWWYGPIWLTLPKSQWPSSSFTPTPEASLPDTKLHTLTSMVTTESTALDILSKFSSWTTLVHVIAYIFRFIDNCKTKNKSASLLSLTEIKRSSQRILLQVQKEQFYPEMNRLKKGQPCSTRIQRLSPFLDADGLIRVGGRLKNASLSYDTKHPILLPKKHHVVNLIIDHYHHLYLHAGPNHLQSLLSQKFWILSARDIVRSRVFRCIRCFRSKPPMITPYMGDLPEKRVTPSRPFSSSGCDYAGPFWIRLHHLRKVQPVKVYLCLFICFSTKAVHLETVTDLTSEAFIAALHRFVSRRGLVSHLYTDCGTSFIGTAKHFNALFKHPDTQHFAENHSITFHFLPPAAPHQGGLWERAVQSCKHHLKRVIGEQILTLEEFMTLTTRVEAMLNSRPLTPLSSNPSELDTLTPGHFLIGEPLVSLAEENLHDVPINRLRRWQLVQCLAQRIWTRWQKEYLHTLQQRPKWIKKTGNLQIGQLVIIHDPNSPPLSWKMGRIVAISPGADGIVRVVTMKTQSGTLTRPAVKVSPLPII